MFLQVYIIEIKRKIELMKISEQLIYFYMLSIKFSTFQNPRFNM